jgi:cell division protein FtsN
MTQQDRGAYTPQTDAPLAFDARAPRGGRRPLPLALIGSAVVLLVLVGAVVMYYRGGSSAPGQAKVVGQPVGAVKTAPPADAQNDDPFSNLDVYASQNVPATAQPAQPTFAPPPEQPQPRPAVEAGLKVQTVEPSTVHAVPGSAAPAQAPAAVAQAQPAPAPAPAAKVATAPAAPTPAPAAPAAASGGAAVQIGAYSSTALADKEFGEVAAAFPGPMAGKSKRVEPLSRDGKTLYRGLINGFADRDAAQAFCNQLKAAGRNCLVRG